MSRHHFHKLIDSFSKDDKVNVRKSGTDDETYNEREQLLCDLSTQIADHAEQKAAKTEAMDEGRCKLLKEGEAVREAAMKGMVKKTNKNPKPNEEGTSKVFEKGFDFPLERNHSVELDVMSEVFFEIEESKICQHLAKAPLNRLSDLTHRRVKLFLLC